MSTNEADNHIYMGGGICKVGKRRRVCGQTCGVLSMQEILRPQRDETTLQGIAFAGPQCNACDEVLFQHEMHLWRHAQEAHRLRT